MKIAIVEDDKATSLYIKDILLRQRYKVDTFDSGDKFLKAFKNKIYDLIILDVNLPDMTGFDICHHLKEMYNETKIIILSERNKQVDINKGLTIGADDYIKKPFDSTEFILRINNLFKNYQNFSIDKIKYKDVIFDFKNFLVIENQKKIFLTKKENELLQYLIINKGITLSKCKIYSEIWDEEFREGNKTLEVYLGKLKKKINVIKENLITLKDIGYQLKN